MDAGNSTRSPEPLRCQVIELCSTCGGVVWPKSARTCAELSVHSPRSATTGTTTERPDPENELENGLEDDLDDELDDVDGL